MHKPLYSEALRHSWQFAWDNKYLWIFGLFAAFLGQMGVLDLLAKVSFASSSYALYPSWLAFPRLWQASVLGTSSLSMPVEGWIWFVWLAIICLGACLFFAFASVVSQGAIIRATYQSVHHKEVKLGQAWNSGVSHFWRLLFLNVFKKISMVLLALVVGYGTLNFVIMESIGGFFLFLFIFLLAVVVGMVISFLVVYAAGYVVVEEYSLGKSILASWHLFTSHWLVSVETGFIILLLNFVVGILAAFAFIIFFLPTLLAWFIGIVSMNFIFITVGTIIGTILTIFAIMFIGSYFTVYTTSVWTYLFMKMHHEGVKSKIIHLLEK